MPSLTPVNQWDDHKWPVTLMTDKNVRQQTATQKPKTVERNGKRRHGFILDQLAPTGIYVQAITVTESHTNYDRIQYLH